MSRGPTQKKNKVGRNSVRKENSAGRAQGQVHGEKKEDDKTMEVEANDVWVKRKERIPLEEISVDDEKWKETENGGRSHGFGENHGTTPWIGIGCGAAMPRAMSVVCWNC